MVLSLSPTLKSFFRLQSPVSSLVSSPQAPVQFHLVKSTVHRACWTGWTGSFPSLKLGASVRLPRSPQADANRPVWKERPCCDRRVTTDKADKSVEADGPASVIDKKRAGSVVLERNQANDCRSTTPPNGMRARQERAEENRKGAAMGLSLLHAIRRMKARKQGCKIYIDHRSPGHIKHPEWQRASPRPASSCGDGRSEHPLSAGSDRVLSVRNRHTLSGHTAEQTAQTLDEHWEHGVSLPTAPWQ